MGFRRGLFVVVIPILAGFVLSACGDDEPTAPATSVVPTQTPSPTATASTSTASPAEGDSIRVPRGFRVVKYLAGIDHPTSMTIGPDGRLYFTQQSGEIYSVADTDGDGIADDKQLVFEGLPLPLGLTFVDGELFVSQRASVVKVVDLDGDGTMDGVTIVVRGLPVGGDLHTNVQNGPVVYGPDGYLYVGIGIDIESETTGGSPGGGHTTPVAGDTSEPREAREPDERAGTIIRFKPDGSDLQIYATGFNNPLGLAFNEQGDLLATDIGPDDPEGPDELNHVVQGADYGYPSGPDQQHRPGDVPVVVELEVAATQGLSFYDGAQFPEQFQGNAFLAQWGQAVDDVVGANRVIRVILTKLGEGYRAVARSFATGFEHPISTVVGPDGSLFVADWGELDFSKSGTGAIYRITYEGP